MNRLKTYADIIADSERLSDVLSKLKGHQSAAQVEEWQAMASAQLEALAASLMGVHYDLRYARRSTVERSGRQAGSAVHVATDSY
jgi:hypothetical protein